MRKWLALSAALFIAGLSCFAQAQAPNVRAVIFPATAPIAAAYSGPGDVVGSAFAWWGLRAYSLARVSNKAARLVRASDSTQQDINTLANGNLDVSSASTFCNATTCKVVTLYDQTGSTNCTGPVACDLTQATDASRPAFTFNCINTSLPCMTFSGAQTLEGPATAGSAQPYTISAVANRNGATSSFGVVVGDSFTDFQDGFANSANTAFMYAGIVQSVGSIADSAWHAFQFVHNGASSNLNADGTGHATSDGGGGLGFPAKLDMGSAAGSNAFTGLATEAGAWTALAFTGTQQTNMCHNQFSYWGTSISC